MPAISGSSCAPPEEVEEADSVRVRSEGDRVVIQGHFRVHKAAHKRVVAFRIGDGPTSLFTMNLPPRPADRGGKWGGWQGPDEAGDTKGGNRAPTLNEMIEIRYAANY